MDVVTIILIVLLISVTIGLVAAPLWQPSPHEPAAAEAVEQPGHSLDELEAQYQATLAAIKDLNFDHEMGKVSTEDYQPLLAKSKLEAARIRQEMDRLSSAEIAEQAQALDDEIEVLIKQQRQNANADEALIREVDAEIEALKALHPVQPAQVDLACPTCGAALRIDDKFCSGCGQAVPEIAANQADRCPDCGYLYQPDDAFCAGCGRSLKETVIEKLENVKI